MNKTALVLALAVLPMTAADAPKSVIPPEIAAQLQHTKGKRMDKVWYDAKAYDRTKGVKLGEVVWAAKASCPELHDSLKKTLQRRCFREAPYTLTLGVTVWDEGMFTAKATIQGTVTDAEGKILAAFEHTAPAHSGISKRVVILQRLAEDLAYAVAGTCDFADGDVKPPKI